MRIRTVSLPGAVRRLIPGRAYQWGPPRREQWIAEYRTGGAEFRLAYRAEQPPQPVRSTDGRQMAFRGWPREFPDAGCLHLRGAWVLGNHGYVVDREGTYLIDTNMWFPDYRHTPAFSLLKRMTTGTLPGRSVSLLSLWANDNFCHYVLEAVPRIAVFLAAGYGWDDVDHVLIPRFSGPSGRWVDKRLGIPPEKLRHVAFGEYLCCDELIATSHPGSPRIVPTWAARFLQALQPVSSNTHGPRIYIPRRSDRRQLVNEMEIQELLVREFGFEVLEAGVQADEVAAMQSARLVVGPHGAGLARTAFCQPGARIVELFSPAWVEPYYWTLAVAGGRPYTAIVGRCVAGSARLGSWASAVNEDFVVDLDDVRRAVRDAISRIES